MGARRDRSRLLTFDGADQDFLYWSTPSWSRPGRGIEHRIVVCKRTGDASCTCEDAVYRLKRGSITAPRSEFCKHVQAVLRWGDRLRALYGE